MSDKAFRFLFVPVSGPAGMGEYARSLVIAMAAARRWPRATIHFVLSREAPYAADVPFAKTLLPSSPTFHPREVSTLIRQFRPHVVVFDNAGRTVQLRAARGAGARIVYISSRSTPRRRAFRPRWMLCIDEHWIAYPQFLAGAPGWKESMKLRLFGRPRLRFLNPLVPEVSAPFAQDVLRQCGVSTGEYIAVVPGGGAERAHTKQTLRAIAEAANGIAANGQNVLQVGLSEPGSAAAEAGTLHVLPRLSGAELSALLRNARLAIVSGGYTMLQALACDVPCIAVPLAGDQPARIAACARAGLVLGGEPDAQALTHTTLNLLGDSARLEHMRQARKRLGLTDGTPTVIEALNGLLAQSRLSR